MTDTEYYDLIRPYDDAMKLLLTRLEILNHNIYKASAENPIHTMQYRIKSKQSIEEKLIRKGEEPTLENAKDLLQDIAGIRIVCYFVGDIKNLIDFNNVSTALLKSDFRENENIVSKKVRRVHFTFDTPVDWSLDGEYGGTVTDVEIVNHQRAVNIIVP